ncbi:MAG: hypothetical protein JSR92_19920 [Proteobacteria bacterium]|nr:hypothetical protein [Pseudomonadota bacterium]
MTAIAAIASAAPITAYANARVSGDLSMYAVDYWPAYRVDLGVDATLTITRAVAAAHPRAINAIAAHGYMDDSYYRVRLIPAALDLGMLANAQTRAVYVWNAWPAAAQTLDATPLTGDAYITVTPPGTLPMAFAPLQMRTWTIGVGLQGPPSIAADLAFTFADATQNVTLPITGTRLAIWGWKPDWANGITERLSWLTDVLASPSGAEQRRALRQSPQVTWDFDAIVSDDERAALDLALFAGLGRQWGVPIWHDVCRLPALTPAGTTVLPTGGGRDFRVGGLAVLLTDALTTEAAEIAAVGPTTITLATPTQSAWPAGTALYPACIAQLITPPQIARDTDTISSAQVQMVSAQDMDYSPVAPLTLYRGLPVMEQPPNEGALTAPWQRVGSVLDNKTGQQAIVDTAGVGFAAAQHAWLLAGRDAHNALRGLLYALRGRQQAIWWPSFAADLRCVATIGAGAVSLDVRSIGYARLAAGAPMRRDIRIELFDGSVFMRRILGASVVDALTERLAIDSALGVAVDPAVIRRISFMTVRRLDTDDIELHHDTDADGVTDCTLVTRALRDDLEAS